MSRGRLLVVDDTEEVLSFLVTCLEREGFDVTSADRVSAARAAIASSSFDAVVTDVELPDGDGMEILPLLEKTTPRTRVIVITAHVDTDRALKALHSGAYDFLPKPIVRDALVSAVKRAVEAVHLERQIEEQRRELEVRVLQRTAELRDANRRLEESRDQVVRAEKMATIGCIAAGVAHEINNPIGFINSNLATLKGYLSELRPVIEECVAQAACEELKAKIEKLDLAYMLDDIDQLVRESEDGVKRVVKIVRDLKTFSHQSTGAPEATDLNECAAIALNLCRSETKHVSDVVFDGAPGLPRVTAWPGEITQVLVNLVANAAQAIGATERHGTIRVRTRVDDGWAVIEVEDDGPGIPREIIGKIFDPFFTTKEPGKGTGLGLSLSSDIVDRHRGEITVVSEVGRGTRFSVRLPLAQAVSEAGIPDFGKTKEA